MAYLYRCKGAVHFILPLLFLLTLTGWGPRALGQSPVTGLVTDSLSQQPMAQVTVILQGTHTGTITDAQGAFTVRVPEEGAVLEFHCTGYASQKFTVRPGQHLGVRMQLENLEVEQVVVTGYQTIGKERATGSFAIVGQQALKQLEVPSLMARLDRVAAGLTFNKQTGQLQIRGVTSLNANVAPLLVVDGMPYEGGLGSINPDLVTSVTVLRDAAAASIYGARAANGVIVIETSKGSGSFEVCYDGLVRVQPIPSLKGLNLMDGHELAQCDDYLFRTFGRGVVKPRPGFWSDDHVRQFHKWDVGQIDQATYQSTLDSLAALDNRAQIRNLLERTALYHSHSLTISGGNQYRMIGTARFEQSFPTDARNTNRTLDLSLRSIAAFTPQLRLDLEGQGLLAHDYTKTGVPQANNLYLTLPPWRMLRSPEGLPLAHYKDRDEQSIQSLVALGLPEERYVPVEELSRSYDQNNNRWARANVALTYSPLEVLSIEGRGAVEYGWQRRDQVDTKNSYTMIKSFNDGTTLSGGKVDEHVFPRGGRLRETLNESFSYTLRLQANYDQSFAAHRVTALLGTEIRSVRSQGSQNELLGYDPLSLSSTPCDEARLTQGLRETAAIWGNFVYSPVRWVSDQEERYTSLYATASYCFQSRYNLTGSLRFDQSNLWGTLPRVQWKPLWSVGASWAIAREPFLQAVRWVDLLTLRASYGIGGNVPRGAYPILTVEPGYNDITNLQTLMLATPPNPELRWEKTATTNVGLDWVLFGSRFSGTLEGYYRHTTDLLGNRSSDPTLGWTTLETNFGELVNYGCELTVAGLMLNVAGVTLSGQVLFSYNESKLLKVYDAETLPVQRVMQAVEVEGYPYASLFSYRYAGLSPDDGSVRIYLKNGTLATRAQKNDDLVWSGTVVPRYTGSLTLSCGWKGLELSVGMMYYGGHVMRKPVPNYASWKMGALGFDRDYRYAWRQPGDELREETIPAFLNRNLAQDEQYAWGAADKHILRADYLQLSTILLRYALPESWLKAIRLKGLRVSFQVDNLVNIPFNKAGIDPATVQLGTAIGQRQRALPPSYTCALHFNL